MWSLSCRQAIASWRWGHTLRWAIDTGIKRNTRRHFRHVSDIIVFIIVEESICVFTRTSVDVAAFGFILFLSTLLLHITARWPFSIGPRFWSFIFWNVSRRRNTLLPEELEQTFVLVEFGLFERKLIAVNALLKAVFGNEDVKSRFVNAQYNAFGDKIAANLLYLLVHFAAGLDVDALLLRTVGTVFLDIALLSSLGKGIDVLAEFNCSIR